MTAIAAIEGINACGKTTIVNELVVHYREQGKNVIRMKTPHSNDLKNRLRKLHQSKVFIKECFDDMEEFCNEMLSPVFNEDYDLILLDRFYMSTLAYWYANVDLFDNIDELIENFGEKKYRMMLNGVDATFYLRLPLDMSVQTVSEQMRARGMEEGNGEYHKLRKYIGKAMDVYELMGFRHMEVYPIDTTIDNYRRDIQDIVGDITYFLDDYFDLDEREV